MIDNFLTRPIFDDPVSAEFSDAALLGDMARVEAGLATAEARVGLVPVSAATAIEAAAQGFEMSVDILDAGVRSAGVPVPALVAGLRNGLGPDDAKWVHFGATSQDIVDSALSLAYGRALSRTAGLLGDLIDALDGASTTHGDTVMLARTRGQMATPITFGLRIAQWAQPLIGAEATLPGIRARALKVQFGGASGNQGAVAPHGPAIADAMAAELGLTPSPPWHTDRSDLRALSAWLGRVTSAVAKMATDLIVSGRGEIAEVRAGAGGGSSTMPHKSNPVASEAIVTLSRAALAAEAALTASAIHGEERDGAMWPAEWLYLPQLFVVTAAALRHGLALASDLRPDAAAMSARIAGTPEVMAEAAVFALARSLGRTEAAALVSKALNASEPFPEALEKLGPEGTDWATVLDPSATVAASSTVARSIFAQRHSA